MRKIAAVLALIMALAAGWAHAEARADGPQWLPPMEWHGVFKWHSDDLVQHVSVSLVRWTVDENGIMIAEGRGRCTVGGEVTRTRVKVSFNLKTQDFEMWERAVRDDPTYVTDGSHVGKLSADHKTINAVWTTTGTGEKGDLLLQADP